MQRLRAVLEVKLGPRIAKSRCVDQIADAAREVAVALTKKKTAAFHSCTPFSTASSSSETFTKIEPPSL